ncbi:MAG: hypothetical protein DLM52_05665 [Chthoniobacterales bacterium]|nr:MAG: hypothetical protein DLM52_05665 [Chthoniobacterales bacterium]
MFLSGFRIVREYQTGVIFRLGRYAGITFCIAAGSSTSFISERSTSNPHAIAGAGVRRTSQASQQHWNYAGRRC